MPSASIETMVAAAKAMANVKSKGACSRYVATAINAGLPDGSKKLNVIWNNSGVKSLKEDAGGLGPANGGQMGPKLREVGFISVHNSYGPEFDSKFGLEVGDVVVVKTVGKSPAAGPPVERPGHVAIWTGSIWVSDFKQPGGRDPNVYRHSATDRVVQYEVYRYSK
jgi:hypothetical protein